MGGVELSDRDPGCFGLKRAEIAARTAELLEFVQRSDRAEAPVEPLSGGMKRRLTIARSLIDSLEILILDGQAVLARQWNTVLDPQGRLGVSVVRASDHARENHLR